MSSDVGKYVTPTHDNLIYRSQYSEAPLGHIEEAGTFATGGLMYYVVWHNYSHSFWVYASEVTILDDHDLALLGMVGQLHAKPVRSW
jgi:hypothetical protein